MPILSGQPRNPIGPILTVANPFAGVSDLPPDAVVLEQTIVGAIKDVFLGVPHLEEYVRVYERERYPETDVEDLAISALPDPISDGKARTSIIQIGIPTVEEFEKTSDSDTQLNFVYPITFDLEVVDEWDNSTGLLYYTNSRMLFMAVYMQSRRAFKNKRDLGFRRCVHEYLQLSNVSLIEDEESGGKLHVADWSLTVKCTGILV